MLLTRPPAAPEVARDLAVCINMLQATTAGADILSAVQTAVGAAARGVHSPRSASQPAFCLADAGNWSFAFIEGCQNAQQGVMAFEGYRGGITDSWTVPRNAYYDQISDNVVAAALANNLLQQPNIVCAGHSMGGAVAEILAGRIHETNRIANVAYCSFGAPKPGSWPTLQAVNQCVAARWFTWDDPVPLLMPTANDNLSMLLAFSVRENQRFTNFAQPFGGLQIDTTGGIEPATYPSQASISTITNIAAWLYSLDTTSGQAHALQTYIARLTANVNDPILNPDRPRHTDRSDDSGGSTRRELTDTQRVALARLQDQERRQHAQPVFIPEEFQADTVRVGRVFQVVVGDTPVAVTSRERTARSMARKYNAVIRSILTQGVVDPRALPLALTSYIAAASVPESAITPKLQTELGEE